MASTRTAQRRACWTMNGSFIRINAWAGTFDTLRRPAVTSGGGIGLRLGRGGAGQSERAAQDQLAQPPFYRPAVPDESIRQVVEQLRMGGSIAERPEIVDGRDEPPAKEVVPDAVHRDPRRQR